MKLPIIALKTVIRSATYGAIVGALILVALFCYSVVTHDLSPNWPEALLTDAIPWYVGGFAALFAGVRVFAAIIRWAFTKSEAVQ